MKYIEIETLVNITKHEHYNPRNDYITFYNSNNFY